MVSSNFSHPFSVRLVCINCLLCLSLQILYIENIGIPLNPHCLETKISVRKLMTIWTHLSLSEQIGIGLPHKYLRGHKCTWKPAQYLPCSTSLRKNQTCSLLFQSSKILLAFWANDNVQDRRQSWRPWKNGIDYTMHGAPSRDIES